MALSNKHEKLKLWIRFWCLALYEIYFSFLNKDRRVDGKHI